MTSDVSLIFSYLVLLDIRYLILEINFNIRFSRYRLNLFQDSVETARFELATPCLQGRCSPN